MNIARTASAPTLAITLYVALILPLEFSTSVGDLRLSPYRVVLILAMIPLLILLIENRRHPPIIVDYLILAHAAWVVIALTVYGGPGAGLESGGIYVVESLGAYLVGRVVVTSMAEQRALLRFMVTLLIVMAMFTLPESLTGFHYIRESARFLVGGPALPVIEPRLGLDRAFGSFDHPILYGVFASSTFAAVYYALNGERMSARGLIILTIVAGSAFLSLSAGPFVGLASQAVILGWDRLTKGIRLRWVGLLSIFLLAWFAVSLASNRSPVRVFITYLTFSPQSGYNRLLVWDYGTAEVGRHTLFGIGLGDWIRAPWMSDSMDNFWLLTAVRYGLPALVFLLAAIFLLGIRQAAACKGDAELNRYRMAWVAMMIGLAVAGITVHFWNALFAYFFFLIGTGVWLVQPTKRLLTKKILLFNAIADHFSRRVAA